MASWGGETIASTWIFLFTVFIYEDFLLFSLFLRFFGIVYHLIYKCRQRDMIIMEFSRSAGPREMCVHVYVFVSWAATKLWTKVAISFYLPIVFSGPSSHPFFCWQLLYPWHCSSLGLQIVSHILVPGVSWANCILSTGTSKPEPRCRRMEGCQCRTTPW